MFSFSQTPLWPFNLLMVADGTRPSPKSALIFRPVVEYAERWTKHSRASCLRLFYNDLFLSPHYGIHTSNQTVKIGSTDQLLISLFLSGLLSVYEKQEVGKKGLGGGCHEDLHGPGPPCCIVLHGCRPTSTTMIALMLLHEPGQRWEEGRVARVGLLFDKGL